MQDKLFSKNKVTVFVISAVLFFCASLSARSATSDQPTPYKVGEWLPSDQTTLEDWQTNIIRATKAKGDVPLIPVIQEFKDLIENDPQLFMLFTQMFQQIPTKPPYNEDPTKKPQVRDYKHMLQLLNTIMMRAPEFNRTGLVGFPINAILDWPMGTPAGTVAFLNSKVNRQLKKILNQWAVFLSSPESCYVLNNDPKHGWFGRDAMKAMPTFADDFVCDPKKPYWGFTSWDNFFTRVFREGRRPIASPKDDAVIANACESAPYKLAHKVKLSDTFWIKAQPYSLVHMLGDEKLAKQFEGGTIYQAFLSALSYHRWHSPVSGTIVKTQNIDGSYYAEAQSMGFDPAGPNESQGYITHVATRGLVLIQADNPDIGLMGVMFVGMAEVSSNEITVYPGQHVEKGDPLGMFHFGGSTHTLLFRPGVELEFDLHGQKPGLHSVNIPVRSRIATVKKTK
ncbi:MAG: phosphatidylserine decarboxylase family protein [Desulfovibrio sp.]|uniref:phosphatidylserine decarboxylase family protein n=1 Tax=Desulfovibrio sp. 7SRBS1 TaxID=3378064 RepID=UPI003B3D8A1B